MRHRRIILIASLAVATLAGCGGSSSGSADDAASASAGSVASGESAVLGTSESRSPGAAAATTAASAPHPGRLLASGCFNCHGTNGVSSGGFESLAGKSSSELLEELREMARPDETSIMRAHSTGYTDAQLLQIADYLSRQSR